MDGESDPIPEDLKARPFPLPFVSRILVGYSQLMLLRGTSEFGINGLSVQDIIGWLDLEGIESNDERQLAFTLFVEAESTMRSLLKTQQAASAQTKPPGTP